MIHFLKYAIVFFKPLSSDTFGVQSNLSFASEMSGFLLRGSSSGKIPKSISDFDSIKSIIISANSRIVISLGFPILNGPKLEFLILMDLI